MRREIVDLPIVGPVERLMPDGPFALDALEAVARGEIPFGSTVPVDEVARARERRRGAAAAGHGDGPPKSG